MSASSETGADRVGSPTICPFADEALFVELIDATLDRPPVEA